MHEASLMRALMRQIEHAAATQRAQRVSAVTVWLGALSHFTPDHFREHFDDAAAGGIAAGAALRLTLSDDLDHPDAQHVRLDAIECEC